MHHGVSTFSIQAFVLSDTDISYTHYWTIVKGEAWPQFIEDAKTIIAAAEIPLSQNGKSYTQPIIDIENGIFFNGADGDDYDFYIHMDDERSDAFCKTGRRPYDLIVTAVLLRAWILGISATIKYVS